MIVMTSAIRCTHSQNVSQLTVRLWPRQEFRGATSFLPDGLPSVSPSTGRSLRDRQPDAPVAPGRCDPVRLTGREVATRSSPVPIGRRSCQRVIGRRLLRPLVSLTGCPTPRVRACVASVQACRGFRSRASSARPRVLHRSTWRNMGSPSRAAARCREPGAPACDCQTSVGQR